MGKYEVIEVCPHCGLENDIYLANEEVLVLTSGKLVCQECGNLLLACSECNERGCDMQPDCFVLRTE